MKRTWRTPRPVLMALCVSTIVATATIARAQCTGCTNPSFGPGFQRFGGEQAPFQFAVADFDQDGFEDVAVPSGTYDGSIDVYHGDGRGGFGTPLLVPIGTSTYPRTVAAADVDGDGIADLIATRSDYDYVWVLRADGLGGFEPPVLYHTNGFGPRYVRTADLDSDGRMDLVVSLGTPGIAIFKGIGAGAFAPAVIVPVAAGATDVAIGDFNEDGVPDIIAAGDSLSVLLGDVSGNLNPGVVIPLSKPAWTIRSATLDADNHLDVVTELGGFIFEASIQVFLGDGTGGFAAGQTIDSDVQSADITLADFDGDGRTDLLVAGLLTVYSGNGDGTFAPALETRIPAGAIETGDFTGDGLSDAVVVTAGVYVLPGRSSSGFDFPPTVPVGLTNPNDVVAAKLAGNASLDLVVPGGFATPTVSIFLGAGDGSFGLPTQYPVEGPSAQSVVAAKLNADANVDLAVVNGVNVSVLLGTGGGTFGPPISYDAGPSPLLAAVGDFNGDTKPDLVVTGQPSQILLGDGAGGFGTPSELPGFNGVWPAVADLNHDGFADVLIASGIDVSVYLGHGDGTFDDPVSFYAGGAADPLVLADFDGDGNLDFPVASTEGVAILFGDGSGAFGTPSLVLPGVGGRFVVGDLNQDGHLDLVLSADNGVLVALGDGAGGFATPGAWVSVNGVVAVTTGDFNGDSKLDVATLGFQDLSILLNTNCSVRRLGVSGQPSHCTPAGQPFAPQPSVGVYDDGGNVVHCAAGIVSASLVPGSGTPGAALGGDTTVPAVSGVAAFTDLSVDLGGSGYEIQFSHPAAGVTRSRAFTAGDPPASSVASNSGPFCQGQDLSLYATAVPAALYRWTGPNGFFSTAQSPVIRAATLDAAGEYSVVALVNGCESSAATTTVTALTPAPGPAILGESQVCYGSRLFLHADDGASIHTWYRDGVPIEGATGPVYSVAQAYYNEAGAYSVSSTDATGCTTSMSAEFDVAIVFCHAVAQGLAVDPGGNGVLEPGESTVIDPSWKNRDIVPLNLVGTLGTFAGPPGGAYAIDDGSADYGTIGPDTSADCFAATGDCYSVTVSGTRPATHWDVFLDEKPGLDPAHTWLLHVGGSFADVPTAHSFYSAIETVLHNGITAGCAPGLYCPGNGVTRAQMAVFLLKARNGAAYDPGPASGTVFADVPANSFAAAWIEQLASMGVTSGCGNGNYCPNQIVTRAQMAVFLLKILFTGPSPCTGIFADVPCPDGFAVDYIETIYNEGVTSGCGQSPLVYCPNNPTTRGQMAIFLTRDFSLLLYGP
jgi:hypothetical protein